jgi:hypothetical protein
VAEQHPVDVAGQWAAPDAPVVNTSAAWTLALATGGATPRLRTTVVAVTP